jgi:peptide chain release factor 3
MKLSLRLACLSFQSLGQLGMGKSFSGVIDIASSQMRMFKAGEDRIGHQADQLVSITDPRLKEKLGESLELLLLR